MKNKKSEYFAVFSIATFIEAVVCVFFFIDCYRNDIIDGTFLGGGSSILFIVLCLLLFLMYIHYTQLRTVKNSNGINEPAFLKIKRYYNTEIIKNSVLLFLFCIISKEYVFEFAIENLSMDLFEAAELCKLYSLFKTYVSILLIIGIIKHILLSVLLENPQISDNSINYDYPEDNGESNLQSDKSDKIKRNSKFLKMYRIIFIVILAFLVVVLLLLIRKMKSSVDFKEIMSKNSRSY